MIRMLSDIGRSSVVVGAVLTVAACAAWTYHLVRLVELARGQSSSDLTAADVVAVSGGALVGLAIAGVTFGLIATIYEIRDSLRTLVDMRLPTPLDKIGSCGALQQSRAEPRIDF